jgi:hypothetical protein
LGLGLAVLFRNSCNGKDCIHFKGPSFNDINGKTYQFGDSCYKYSAVSSTCDANRQTLEFANFEKPKSMLEGMDPTITPGITTPSTSDSFSDFFKKIWDKITEYYYYTLK